VNIWRGGIASRNFKNKKKQKGFFISGAGMVIKSKNKNNQKGRYSVFRI
jgi:hypothetical protein